MSKNFFSCDWGTTSFRLRLININSGTVLAASVSDEGIGWANETFVQSGNAIHNRVAFFYAIIERHIKKIEAQVKGIEPNIPVMISGMASSNIGIVELPYTMLPFSTSGEDMGVKRLGKEYSLSHELNIISGARTANDVMRGEETQLIGCANGHEQAKELFIFPGTHSKHITTLGSKATDLKTYMTGELFSLLSVNSLLADSIAPPNSTDSQESEHAFEAGVQTGQQENLSHALFIVRTNHLLKRFSKASNYHFLSGVLIGAELGDLNKMDTGPITIAGEEKLMARYVRACTIIDVRAPITTIDAATATIQGQLAIYRRLYA